MVAEALRTVPVREHSVAVGPAQDTLRKLVTEVAACGHAGTDQAVQVLDSFMGSHVRQPVEDGRESAPPDVAESHGGEARVRESAARFECFAVPGNSHHHAAPVAGQAPELKPADSSDRSR